jgi:hypothetical protein
MAKAASNAASRLSPNSLLHKSMPALILSIGKGTPMTPVEQTSTSSALQPSTEPAWAAVASVSFSPCSAVQALALPLLMTMALTLSWVDTSFWSQSTGAAFTRLVVKEPANEQGT